MKQLHKNLPFAFGVILPVFLGLAACDQEGDTSQDSDLEDVQTETQAPQYVIPEPVELQVPAESNVELDTSNWSITPPFYAAGQEPFWRLELNDGWFIFQRLGLPEIEAQINSPVKNGNEDQFTMDGFTISMTAGACRNAQANEPVRGAITLVHDEVSYQGCVYKGQTQSEDPAGSEADNTPSKWTNEIGIYAIEADACLKALEEVSSGASKKALVTAMQARKGGLTAFVLQTARRNDYLCIARDTGGIEEITALGNKKREDWMKVSAKFMRVVSGPPPRACLDAEAVMVDNQLTGYLLPRNCRP